jgi:hypothetical protein
MATGRHSDQLVSSRCLLSRVFLACSRMVDYFCSMQVLAAAERPPSLKAIFISGGHYDFYETTYHGGIMWFMPRAAREGRGGDSGWAFSDNVKSGMIEKYSSDDLKQLVAKRLQDQTSQRGRTWSMS